MDPRKRSVGATERDEFLRATWRTLVADGIDARRLVFVDEMGSNTTLRPLCACSRRGERAPESVPRNRGKNVTLLSDMTIRGMGLSMAVEGATMRAVFEAYVEEVLAPSLVEGQVVILDGLGAHRTARVRELVEGRGCDLVFLPSYSPDLNPIEEAFSKIKNLVRQAGERTREALNEAIAAALRAIRPGDVVGWFAHCGCYESRDHYS